MELHRSIIYVIMTFVLLNTSIIDGFPWDDFQKQPICTSHDLLCDITFEHSSMPLPSHEGPICHCPEDTDCSAAQNDPRRTLKLQMILSGQKLTAMLSYCTARPIITRTCKTNEVAAMLLEKGPMMFEIVGEISCLCPEPLVLQKAVPDGPFSLQKYVCGQPVCDINRSKRPVCERVTHTKSGLVSDLPCQCPAGYYCHSSYVLDIFTSGSADLYCEPNLNYF